MSNYTEIGTGLRYRPNKEYLCSEREVVVTSKLSLIVPDIFVFNCVQLA